MSNRVEAPRPAPRAVGGARRWSAVAGAAIGTAVVVFVVAAISRDRDEISQALGRLHPCPLLSVTSFIGLAMTGNGVASRARVRALGRAREDLMSEHVARPLQERLETP